MTAPLVLLPGMNCTGDLWRGTGLDTEDGGAIRPVLDRPALRDQVDALLRDLPPRVVLVGHSLGGIVAMALAIAAPERVDGLCLVSTNAKAPTAAQRDGWRAWIERLDDGVSPRALQGEILEPLLGAEVAATRSDLVERTLGMGDATGAAVLRAQLELQLTRVDLLSRLSSLRIPTLAVSGIDDVICPPRFHTEIVAEIEGARLVSLDAGHLLPVERPREFGDLVRSWRSQQLRPAAVGA
ncbi:alpha/beta fold hydrolase [Microbacterium sp. NPDC089695]|uniref:alpha/beta fold hydrolase n=1 Tax=Microbacterium sp. NPDC089695 TaxID=3364198 RepID=UPI0038269A14